MNIIGQTKEVYGSDDFPSIFELISSTPLEEKDKLVSYLKSGQVIAASPARLIDVINGDSFSGEMLFMTDGQFGWRSDVIHYVEKYNMQLPEEFKRKALS